MAGLVTTDITYTGNSKAGVKNKGVLINLDDIASTTRNATNGMVLLDDITLKSGKTGYDVSTTNRAWKFTDELVPGDENRYRHMVENVIVDASVLANMQQAAEMSKDNISKYVLVIARQYGEKYEVLGVDMGLVVTSNRRALGENNANRVLTLSTEEGMEEPNPIAELVETDAATTTTAFNAKFAAP